MKTWSSTNYSTSPQSFFYPVPIEPTASTYHPQLLSLAAYEQCDYLSHINSKLLNQITDTTTQKHFYKNRLTNTYKQHTSQLEQLYQIINQKNNIILFMQQTIDKIKKINRQLQDQYICQKNNHLSQKQFFQKQIINIQNKSQSKIKHLQQSLQQNYQQKLKTRLQQITNQYQQRIKLYTTQIQQLASTSNQFKQQLKSMKQQYLDLLIKNDQNIKQSIARQLQKRYHHLQHNSKQQISQVQSLLSQNKQLKQQLSTAQQTINNFTTENSILKSQLQSQTTSYNQILQLYQQQKIQNSSLQQKNYALTRISPQTISTSTNTQQKYLPYLLPVDLDIIQQLIKIKQYIIQQIFRIFLQFFNKTTIANPNKKSLSFITFQNSISSFQSYHPENINLIVIKQKLQNIIKIYCPALIPTRQSLTIKDDFIKQTLMQCQTIKNPTQKLYRILQLINRLKYPVTHQQASISPGQLKMIQIKLMNTIKKVFHQ